MRAGATSVFNAKEIEIALSCPKFLENHPEVARISDRYLSKASAQRTDNGFVVFVPTRIQAQKLQQWQGTLERALEGAVVSFEVQKKSGERQKRAERTPLDQFSLPLAPKNPLEDQIERETAKRIQPPPFVGSPALDLSRQLVGRWAEMVNAGNNSLCLWVYGEAGSGKSTLIKQLSGLINLDKRLVFVDVNAFFQEWRRALDQKDVFSFNKKYRSETDVFVLENLDDLRGRMGTQQEVLFTVNALIERGASFAVSSTTLPNELQQDLEPQLFSRLLSGMTVEMPRPDRVFKENLWRSLLEQHGLKDYPLDLMIQERLISLPFNTTRKVHTVYINAIARLSLQKTLSLRDISELEGVHRSAEHPQMHAGHNPRQMIDQVARLCGVSASAIIGKVRRSDVSTARKFVCLALSRFLGLPNSTIAHYIEKDPSTISYSLKIVEKEIESDRHMSQQWNWICSQLGMRA